MLFRDRIFPPWSVQLETLSATGETGHGSGGPRSSRPVDRSAGPTLAAAGLAPVHQELAISTLLLVPPETGVALCPVIVVVTRLSAAHSGGTYLPGGQHPSEFAVRP